MTTIGGQLRKALERKAMKITAFQQALDDKGVPGSSYPMIHRYLADTREPSLELLREAAELLGVRLQWLISGDEPMTVEEEQAQTAMEPEWEKAVQEHRERIGEVRSALDNAAPFTVSPVAFAVFLRTWNRMRTDQRVEFADAQLSVETFARALMAPLTESRHEIGKPDFMEVEDYVLEVAPAIGRALAARWRKSLSEPSPNKEEENNA